MRTHLIFLFILLHSFSGLNAQELICTSGGIWKGSSIQISWSMGELAIESYETPPFILTQGFQQPGLKITSIHEMSEFIMDISVYPNPASDWVYLKMSTGISSDVRLDLIDAQGRIIEDMKVKDELTKIPFKDFPASIYFLRIIVDGINVMTYVIIKI